jgi:hypothetical protein
LKRGDKRVAEDFEIIGKIEEIVTIAVGSQIRELARLRKAFARGAGAS